MPTLLGSERGQESSGSRPGLPLRLAHAVATAALEDDTGVYTVRPDGSDWTLRMQGYWSWLTWQPLAG